MLKESSFLQHGALLRILTMIRVLCKSHWSVEQLAERLDISTSTVYRYVQVLEAVGYLFESQHENTLFIITEREDSIHFTQEELRYLEKMLHTAPRAVLKTSILKKLNVGVGAVGAPMLHKREDLGTFINKISRAIDDRNRVLLKSYHSAHSEQIKDRIIEPIQFGTDYETIYALDTADQKCKFFRLDRIGDVVIKRIRFKFENLHAIMPIDSFGYTGATKKTITLHLTLRAYLRMAEAYPNTKTEIKEVGKNRYLFSGDVYHFDGIGEFALSKLNDVKVISPPEFKSYLMRRLEKCTF